MLHTSGSRAQARREAPKRRSCSKPDMRSLAFIQSNAQEDPRLPLCVVSVTSSETMQRSTMGVLRCKNAKPIKHMICASETLQLTKKL